MEDDEEILSIWVC